MKVFIAPFYSNVNSYQKILKEALERRGIDVCVSKPPFEKSLTQEFESSGADVLYLHWVHQPIVSEKPLLESKEFLTSLNYIADNYRLVYRMHNKVNHSLENKFLDKHVRGRVIESADEILVWDEATKNYVEDTYGFSESIKVPHLNYTSDYEDFEVEYNRFEKDYQNVFVFTGMIRDYKQVPSLIKDFKDLDSSQNFLYVAGKVADLKMGSKSSLKSEISEMCRGEKNIVFKDEYLNNLEMYKIYEASDVAVFPYRDIFNSGSVINAMSLSTAVITPDKGSSRSVLPESNFVYEEGGLKCALVKASNCENLKTIGKKNFDKVSEKNSVDRVVSKVVEILND